jgi:hypothetical protein
MRVHGVTRTPLTVLCQHIPWVHGSDPELMPVLFATMVAATLDNERNKELMEREMSLEMIHTYVTSQPAQGAAGPSCVTDVSERFPPELWSTAAEFFASSSDDEVK